VQILFVLLGFIVKCRAACRPDLRS